ncbi:coiled-coil domain-containing protein 134-like [Onthophagus taurus]|uniref:coiled-coil domain-containing protein 134-like n=1 Tax=Onthophagus taurus TaxID=166361 RepID=UPI000C20EAF5|nr:coiled-coil domain-containing protein 134-like [Onthophagus taurus]
MEILFLFFLLFDLTPLLCTGNGLKENPEVAEKLYIQLFKRKRAEQLAGVKTLQTFPYEKQYSMTLLMTEKIFTVIQESRAFIESSSYIPGVSEFPTEEKVRDSLSNILENTALFSEIILRIPQIGSSVLKTNNNWDVLLQWSIAFCNQVRYLLDSSTIKLLHLASQELGHIDKDPNYFNPYAVKNKNLEEENVIKKKEKKKIKKGPKLRGYEL